MKEPRVRDARFGDRGAAWRTTLTDWVQRYGLAECAGVTCALVLAYVVRRATGNDVATAYGGAWGESIGYGATMILRDYRAAARTARMDGRRVNGRDAGRVATGLLTEFGPATILDTFVLRPLAMGIGMRALGPRRGLVAGKLAADLVFYLPVIIMYERRKRAARSRILP